AWAPPGMTCRYGAGAQYSRGAGTASSHGRAPRQQQETDAGGRDDLAGGKGVFAAERNPVDRAACLAEHAHLAGVRREPLALARGLRHAPVPVLGRPEQDAPVAAAVLHQEDAVRARDLEAAAQHE